MSTTAERVPLRIGNLEKNLLYLGQVYLDPRDALNEFVSNAADEYVQAHRHAGIIRITLHRRGRRPFVKVSDDGRGMDRDKLRQVAQSLCQSEKAGGAAEAVVGEKGIGLLAFATLGDRCEITSRASGETATHTLRLARGEAECALAEEGPRARDRSGTDVTISGLTPDVLRVLTLPKLAEYFRIRRRQALLRGDYAIQLFEGDRSAFVRPEEYRGAPFVVLPRTTPFGLVDFHLFLWPHGGERRRVAVVGKGGTTIFDDLASLEEFAREPWASDQVEGEVVFPALEQTTGRKGLLRDAERFPAFVEAVRAVEPDLRKEVERLREAHLAAIDRRLYRILREVMTKVLRDLRDLESPLRAPAAASDGMPAPGLAGPPAAGASGGASGGSEEGPGASRAAGGGGAVDPEGSLLVRQRMRAIPHWEPRAFAADRAHLRSELDEAAGVISVNTRHPDYVAEARTPAALLQYLLTVTAKELAAWQHPRALPGEATEAMVRILVAAHRHLPKRV